MNRKMVIIIIVLLGVVWLSSPADAAWWSPYLHDGDFEMDSEYVYGGNGVYETRLGHWWLETASDQRTIRGGQEGCGDNYWNNGYENSITQYFDFPGGGMYTSWFGGGTNYTVKIQRWDTYTGECWNGTDYAGATLIWEHGFSTFDGGSHIETSLPSGCYQISFKPYLSSMWMDAVWLGPISFPGCEYLTPGETPSVACEGIEVIASPVVLDTDEGWSDEESIPDYDYYRARYTIWNDHDVTNYVDGIGVLNDDYIWFFSSADAGEIYSFSTDEEDNSGATASLAFTNTAYVTTTLLSACIYESFPDEGPEVCLNPSPNLNLPAYYSTNGTLVDGIATLTGVESISTTLALAAGDYTMSAWARGENWAMLTIGNGIEFVGEYVPGGLGWSAFDFDFTLDAATTITPSVTAAFSQYNIEVTYICIADRDASLPAPDPPEGCMNPDPTFGFPDIWYPSGGAEVANAMLSLPSGGDSVTTTVVLDEPGAYRISLSALAEPVETMMASSLRIAFAGENSALGITQDAIWRDYAWDQEVAEAVTATLVISSAAYSPGGIYLSYFCITYLGDDPPTEPFPPGGDLSACMNPDPGLDNQYAWIGTAAITDSVASLAAGESVVQAVEIADRFSEYYLHVVARSSTSAQANATVSWRGAEQNISVVGTAWITQVLTFPRQEGNLHPVLEIVAAAGNTSDVEIDIICITAMDWTPPPGVEELDVWHPVCLDNYLVQTPYSEPFPALLIGTGRTGMPVHAVTAGVVVSTGVQLIFNSTTYSDCVVIDHSHFYEVDIRSASCGLSAEVSVEQLVNRGEIIGYTGADMISDGQVLAALQVKQGWENDLQWINPEAYYIGYPDCFPYRITIPLVDECVLDAGNDSFVAPRFDPSLPSVWDPEDWIPYLVQMLYDRVAYPVLCGLIPLVNFVLGAMEAAINALISAISPVIAFIYRIGMFFSYLLRRLGDLAQAVMDALGAGGDLFTCGRETLGYFLDALRYATQAHTDLETMDTSSTITIGMGVALTLVSSTVANTFLTPMVLLIMAFAAWQLIPWGIREFRAAVGAGGD